MADTWIINASPLILLARIGRLDWLDALAENPLVPAQVIEEVSAGQASDPSAKTAVLWASRYRIEKIRDVRQRTAASRGTGGGWRIN